MSNAGAAFPSVSSGSARSTMSSAVACKMYTTLQRSSRERELRGALTRSLISATVMRLCGRSAHTSCAPLETLPLPVKTATNGVTPGTSGRPELAILLPASVTALRALSRLGYVNVLATWRKGVE